MRISRRPRPLGQPSAVTIGSFDGLHLGHQRLIEALNQAAHSRGLASTVVTFEPQPREFFDPKGAPARLAALNDKVRRLSAMGVDQLVVLPFNSALRAMSAAEFVQKILLDGLNARWVQVGDDFRFGNDRRGDVDFLRQYDFEVQQLESQRLGDDRVSSTAIRTCLAEGRLNEAAELLGEPYTLSGRVVHGRKLGRTIGVPTANILLNHPKLATNGVFVVRTRVGDRWIPGVANLGPKPTVGDTRNWLEVHLFDTELDLYGQRLDVQLWQRLRGIERFDNLDALKNQIQRDINQARDWFNINDRQHL
ncbi:bifunctional riboflavin kinase/FAD synthetase [Saccharospirillum mangrovi]|uniref:bifunctional riboflavin kinase/FAD synthetase n=1 Tax=Saccharospirillum mangrovi TaxID=2161747 RepID=UPI000D3DA1A4|nr:bifunctional riboflavin kinase/FAD synthetase [Saccharospirillum mangrovi]